MTMPPYEPSAYPPRGGVYQQNRDGSWSPAQPIGWLEEHGPVARLIFWLRGIEHCNDREGQRRQRWRRSADDVWISTTTGEPLPPESIPPSLSASRDSDGNAQAGER